MSNFVKIGNEFVNMDLVTHIRQTNLKGTREIYSVFIGSLRFESFDWRPGLELTTVVAAQPGFYGVTVLCDGEEPPYLWTCPIVAWSIADGCASPILIEPGDDTDTLAILSPDGKVSLPGDRSFDSIVEFSAYEVTNYREAYLQRKAALLNKKNAINATSPA